MPSNTDTDQPIDSPYLHNKLALGFESEKRLREAEQEYKKAIQAADALPMGDYLDNFVQELEKYRKSPQYEVSPGVGLQKLKESYHRLIVLPFMTRFQLASFYARNGGLQEAKEVMEQALALGIEEFVRQDSEVQKITARAEEFVRAVHDVMGPENLPDLFENLFDKLDSNHNGFVHESELRRAQFDISIGPDGQSMIRHLIYHYLDVEASSNDEWGVDINGISINDVRAFEEKKSGGWRRLTNPGND
jgi:tetratricopeptide (TPR) repeat protein